MAFELVSFVEPAPAPGEPFKGTIETQMGVFDTEAEAVREGREAWTSARENPSADVRWWIVRVPGEQLARWLADAASPNEQVLDLSTNTLVSM